MFKNLKRKRKTRRRIEGNIEKNGKNCNIQK